MRVVTKKSNASKETYANLKNLLANKNLYNNRNYFHVFFTAENKIEILRYNSVN
jgi:hypothetical protein